MSIDEKIANGNIIKSLREERHESQGTFSKAIGIKQSYLSLIENGERELTLDLAKSIADYCKVDINRIISISSSNILQEKPDDYLSQRPDCKELRVKCELLQKMLEERDKEAEFYKRVIEMQQNTIHTLAQNANKQ